MNNHPISEPVRFWFWWLIVPMIVLGMIWPPLALVPVLIHAVWIGFGVWLGWTGFMGS